LVWLLHFVAQQPTGPATWMSRSIGALTTVALVTTALCLAVVLRQRARYRRARGKLVYRALGDGSRSTVLILVVNDIERNAVIAAAGGPDPVVDQFGAHAIYRLGRFGSTDVVLAQSQQGTVDAGAMTLTSEALLRRLRPGAAILTGICYGLKSRELDGGDQEIGDVVVSTQLRGMDHKKVTERPGGVRREINRGERVSPSPRLLSSARALAWNWPRPAVHTGPVVSLNTLVDSAAERRRIKIAEEEAVAGEMELAGLHAAATLTKTDWILVKGISDWGVGKSDGDQKRAARNAADFVVALIARIVPAGPDDA
jgi:nucleoside phosphorylase